MGCRRCGCGLRDNILVLIDELDLYCHPAWQRKLLIDILDELKTQFTGKNVQLIFTTHSPIVLSDIPKSNTIYLKRNDNGKLEVDNLQNHNETFGANIYKLFNDAFFLERHGQIGEFAEFKIQKIVRRLWDKKEKQLKELSEEEFIDLKLQINKIGDILLREKLLEMLFDSRYSELDYKKRKIELYKQKLSDLGENDD